MINEFVKLTYKESSDAGWWDGLGDNPVVVPLKLSLIHSEISEALEADRKNLMDDKLTHRQGIEVELADAIIRIADLAGFLGLDLDGAIKEKMEFNRHREDHQKEARNKENGKKY